MCLRTHARNFDERLGNVGGGRLGVGTDETNLTDQWAIGAKRE